MSILLLIYVDNIIVCVNRGGCPSMSHCLTLHHFHHEGSRTSSLFHWHRSLNSFEWPLPDSVQVCFKVASKIWPSPRKTSCHDSCFHQTSLGPWWRTTLWSYNLSSHVGTLQYVTMTRPDVSFVVGLAIQYKHQPRLPYLQEVKCIFRYLVGMLNFGLLLHCHSRLDLHTYAYADWAGCQDTGRSTLGYCIFLGNNLISWRSKKQISVAHSSTEA